MHPLDKKLEDATRSKNIESHNGGIKGVVQSKKTFDMCYQTLRESHRNKQN
jgi:hypothetical protein